MKETPLPQRMAERLKARIAGEAGSRLPSIEALAQEQGVSQVTMWRAVQILVTEGLVECRKGRGIAICGRPRQLPSSRSSSDSLVEKIRAAIADGTYHTGEALPKVVYFTIEAQKSRTTVVAALRRLEREGSVHKQGNRWIVGPGIVSVNAHRSARGQRQVVLFLVHNQVYWKTLFQNGFVSPFLSAFLSELRKYRFSVSLIATHIPSDELGVLPTGATQVRETVRSLGSRYQGAIVSYYTSESLSQAVGLLSGCGRPIVEFNPTNEPLLVPGGISRTKKAPLFRLHLDEPAGVRLALEHVAGLGHRRIGVPAFTPAGYEWAERRVEAIRECASRHFPHVQVTVEDQKEEWWSRLGADSSITEFMSAAGVLPAIFESRLPLPAKERTALVDKTPSLASLLGLGRVTAIIALNNELARKYFFWFMLAGIRIPDQLSMISFDDTPESVTFPITTIDFGFARLGYLAAHILIGDIPIKAGRHGDMPGECELVDRGSVRLVTGDGFRMYFPESRSTVNSG